MKPFLLAAAVVLAVAGVGVGALVSPAHAQVPTPPSFSRPDQARFRLVAEDGIVQPDGRTYIAGTKIWTVADKASGQCYLVFLVGSGTGTSLTGPISCP